MNQMTEAEREHVADIDRLRSELEKGIAGAQAELRAAVDAYRHLADGVYDVEYAEGYGVDVGHHLEVAARALRAADALRLRVASIGAHCPTCVSNDTTERCAGPTISS